MKLKGVPFETIDWSGVPAVTHAGETGSALWRTKKFGNVRVRMVDYSPGYRADHWCSRGHVILVVEGELVTEVQGGPSHTLGPGTSYCVSDDVAPHRSKSDVGARLFIVD